MATKIWDALNNDSEVAAIDDIMKKHGMTYDNMVITLSIYTMTYIYHIVQ